ncbi:MAG: protoporphyrinogen oxidase [Bryobacteraceae bacterium]
MKSSETFVHKDVGAGSVTIVGGGISGLATAYFLGKHGTRSTLIEKSNRLGGLIKTDLIEGCQLEAGPDSYIASKPAVTELARELGDLGNQIIGSNDEARRIFVVRRGKLVPIPKGMVMMVPGQWTPALRSELFSVKTKLRFLVETLSAPRKRTEDVSVEKFVDDHFGKEMLDYVTEPLLSGVYGGDPSNLSVESVLPRFLRYERVYGSLIRGLRHERSQSSRGNSAFLSFAGGMQTLIDSLTAASAAFMDVIYGEAAGIERSDGRWLLKVGNNWTRTDQIVLACPAHVCSQLLENAEPTLASKLAEIPYSSAILVTLAYERSKLRHALDGFGFLVPRIERRNIAAATWVSTKFPSRAPIKTAVLRAFIVGKEAEQLLDAPSQSLADLVHEELAKLMGLEQLPLSHTVNLWPRSMPQYVVGHGLRRLHIAQALDHCPGLYLVGSAYDGVGVPDCVQMAKQTAKSILTERSVMRTTVESRIKN